MYQTCVVLRGIFDTFSLIHPQFLKGKKMNFADKCKATGIKLELSVFRGSSWRKFAKGKMYYLSHPVTAQGYQDALQEWNEIKAGLTDSRPYAAHYTHMITVFSDVVKCFNDDEKLLKKQTENWLQFLQELFAKKELNQIPLGSFTGSTFVNEFFESEFDGKNYNFVDEHYQLPDKWKYRVSQNKPVEAKPTSIKYWYDQYLARLNQRAAQGLIVKPWNRKYQLQNFIDFVNPQNHIDKLDNTFLVDFHNHLIGKTLSVDSKQVYWKAITMFLKWLSQETDYTLPKKYGSREFTFADNDGTGRKREDEKLLLWSKEDVAKIKTLKHKYQTYCLLMLNCGFRHTDLANLRNTDIRWTEKRIVIQRNKLKKQKTAPVISYKLWDITFQHLSEYQSDEKLVFGQIVRSLQAYWERRGKKIIDKNMNQLRKTGATIIDAHTRGVSDMYLGESLASTAKVHYVFNDGEPCQALDNAIQQLGFHFGFCEEPKRKVELTPDMILTLKNAGFQI